MSVGFWMSKPEQVFLGGRAEAAWLCHHAPHTTDTEGTTSVDISDDFIAEMVSSAKASERAARRAGTKEVRLGQYDVMTLKEHQRITKELPKELRFLHKRCASETGHDWFGIVVSW